MVNETIMNNIHLQLTVQPHSWFPHLFTVIDGNYEPGYPVGDGKTIQEAIDDYLEQAHDFYIVSWTYDSLTYNWK